MNQDKVFENLKLDQNSLWERIQTYADELNLQEEDETVFTEDRQAKMSFYITNYVNSIVSVGIHLARVKKIRQQLEHKKERLFGSQYVAITDACVEGRNSSKYDKEYRTGKVLVNPEYRDVAKLVSDVSELEATLEAIKNALQIKAMVLPTMFKLDTQY